MTDASSRMRVFFKRLLNDVLRWGPAGRLQSIPEAQQEKVFDEHWRNG